MNCIKCGNNLGENDVFCPNCGTRVQKSEESNDSTRNEGMNYNYERATNQQPNGQNYGQPNNYSGQYGSKKGNGSLAKTCAILVITVAILVALGLAAYSLVSVLTKNNNTRDEELSSGTLSSQQTPTPNENSGSVSQVTNQQTTSTYKVNYAGFKLYIPDDLIYEFDTTNDAINIGDALSTWVAQLSIQKLPFQQLKQNKSYLSSYLTEYLSSYNAKVSNATLETIDGVEFILMEIDLAGTHEIMAVSELNSMYAAYLEVANENNDYDRNVLKNITPILKTAEYDGSSKNLETNGKIKTTDINKALQKAVEGKTNN